METPRPLVYVRVHPNTYVPGRGHQGIDRGGSEQVVRVRACVVFDTTSGAGGRGPTPGGARANIRASCCPLALFGNQARGGAGLHLTCLLCVGRRTVVGVLPAAGSASTLDGRPRWSLHALAALVALRLAKAIRRLPLHLPPQPSKLADNDALAARSPLCGWMGLHPAGRCAWSNTNTNTQAAGRLRAGAGRAAGGRQGSFTSPCRVSRNPIGCSPPRTRG